MHKNISESINNLPSISATIQQYKLFANSDIVKKVKVWEGKKSNLNMRISEDINLLLNIRTKRNLNAKILFNEPIIATILVVPISNPTNKLFSFILFFLNNYLIFKIQIN